MMHDVIWWALDLFAPHMRLKIHVTHAYLVYISIIIAPVIRLNVLHFLYNVVDLMYQEEK